MKRELDNREAVGITMAAEHLRDGAYRLALHKTVSSVEFSLTAAFYVYGDRSGV